MIWHCQQSQLTSIYHGAYPPCWQSFITTALSLLALLIRLKLELPRVLADTHYLGAEPIWCSPWHGTWITSGTRESGMTLTSFLDKKAKSLFTEEGAWDWFSFPPWKYLKRTEYVFGELKKHFLFVIVIMLQFPTTKSSLLTCNLHVFHVSGSLPYHAHASCRLPQTCSSLISRIHSIFECALPIQSTIWKQSFGF